MLPIIFINLFIGFVGRSFIGNSAHLSGLFAGALLALFVDYRRPGARASIATIWRVSQVLCLALIVLAGYKIARTFNRPAAIARVTPSGPAVVFKNYVNVMTQVQEKASAVIHNNDLTDVPVVTQRAMQAPVPDARAAELRQQLLVILSKLTSAAAAASSDTPYGPGRPPQLDPKLVDEYKQWGKQYNDWLKIAARSYAAE
jgi:hypothetical protein